MAAPKQTTDRSEKDKELPASGPTAPSLGKKKYKAKASIPGQRKRSSDRQTPSEAKAPESEEQDRPGVVGPTAPAPAGDEIGESISAQDVRDNKKGGYGAG